MSDNNKFLIYVKTSYGLGYELIGKCGSYELAENESKTYHANNKHEDSIVNDNKHVDNKEMARPGDTYIVEVNYEKGRRIISGSF